MRDAKTTKAAGGRGAGRGAARPLAGEDPPVPPVPVQSDEDRWNRLVTTLSLLLEVRAREGRS